jgi:hypothetical protein
MWKKNFLFRAHEAAPLKESENELFHDAEPALDSAGLQMEKFLSVWVQGEGEDDSPSMYTNIYVRTATLDFRTRAGFLQPLQGRSHQIKQMLTPEQKGFLREWLSTSVSASLGGIGRPFSNFVRPRVICFQQDAENVRQRRSRVIQILNVPQGYASDLHSLRPC